MVTIKINVDDHDLANAFRRKGAQVNRKIDQLARDIVDALELWIKYEAPRKTGRTKSSIQKKTWGSRGLIWVSKAIAPHVFYVIDGTRPHKIRAKHKKALRVPGYGVFKSVKHPGTRPNPFVDKGKAKAQGDIDRKVRAFEQWITEV